MPFPYYCVYRFYILLFMVAPPLPAPAVDNCFSMSLALLGTQKEFLKQASVPALTSEPNNFIQFNS